MQRGIHLLHFYERKEKMDYIEQAHALTNDEKAQALLIYTQCIKEFARKKYRIRCDDPFVDLSSLFGECWMIENGYGVSSLSAEAYAKANVAFNFANLELGAGGEFISTAKAHVPASKRVKDKKLYLFARAMNQVVTATTAEIWRQRVPYMR